MNSIKKITLVGCALITSTALLVSFTKGNGGDKNKKYQIIHHSNGEMITHDTIIPMTSTYTPEQFVVDMGISGENVEIIKIPAISEIDMDGKTMRTFIHEVKIDDDGNGSAEEVEIKVEIDENGKMITKKTLNGVEVEMTEDELSEIKSFQGDHGKVIQMRFGDEEIGDKEERIEISVEIGDDGNKIIKKIVNGKEVEMTEDEMDDLEIFEMVDDDDMNVFFHHNGSDGDIEEMKIEIKKMIEIHSGGDHDHTWTSDDGEQHIILISSDNEEDHTTVLVTENYNETTSGKTKIIIENSLEEMNVFPNPNEGTFKIRYESDENKKTTVTVNDATGKTVFEKKLGKFSGRYEKELNLKKFGSGMYTVTIQNGNNKEVQKVMIK